MFVRFRQTRSRLQVSLIATRRVDGRVRQDHIAGLGSVPLSPTPHDRFEFWRELHATLARLDNRLDDASRFRILGDIAGRVPMLTVTEQTALQVETAKAGAAEWRMIADLNTAAGTNHRALADRAGARARDFTTRASDAAEKAAAADALVGWIERGEASGSVRRPLTQKEWREAAGWSVSDLRWARISAALPADVQAEVETEISEGKREPEYRRAIRKVLARRGLRIRPSFGRS